MQAVLDQGMIKAVGVSEGSVEHIRRIHAIVPVSLIELEWSLFTRESEVSAPAVTGPVAEVRMYLVCLKYWTLNLRPLMVYPKVLFIQTLASKVTGLTP